MADPDARRRAEEALAKWDEHDSYFRERGRKYEGMSRACARSLADALRACLAAEPAKAPFVSRNEEWGLRPDFTTAGVTAPPAGAEVARLTALLRECNAVCICGCPDSEHESYGEDGESCGDEEHECLRVAPAVLEIVQRYRVALSDALAQKPAGAEVREAAEVVRTILTAHDARLSESGVLTYGPPSKGTGFVAAIQWLRRYDAARGGE